MSEDEQYAKEAHGTLSKKEKENEMQCTDV
jgi:hypothetical protein